MYEQTISPLAADQQDSFFITEKCTSSHGNFTENFHYNKKSRFVRYSRFLSG